LRSFGFPWQWLDGHYRPGQPAISRLSPESARLLEKEVLALGLPLRDGLAVEVSPLSGRDETEIADGRSLADEIRREAKALGLAEKLAAKMSVVIDGGGYVSMGDLLADIRLKAQRLEGQVFWRLFVGGPESSSVDAGLVGAAPQLVSSLNCSRFWQKKVRSPAVAIWIGR